MLHGGPTLLSGRRLAYAQHDIAGLLAGLDVTDRLDDLVERIRPVDHRPVLLRIDELLDQDEVGLAIATDAELRLLASDEARRQCDERYVVHEPEVGRDVDPAGLQRPP